MTNQDLPAAELAQPTTATLSKATRSIMLSLMNSARRNPPRIERSVSNTR
jgi:hypothetical protein